MYIYICIACIHYTVVTTFPGTFREKNVIKCPRNVSDGTVYNQRGNSPGVPIMVIAQLFLVGCNWIITNKHNNQFECYKYIRYYVFECSKLEWIRKRKTESLKFASEWSQSIRHFQAFWYWIWYIKLSKGLCRPMVRLGTHIHIYKF